MMKGYKGFDKNLQCRGFQYKIGQTYATDQTPIRCTENGFHFCENPLDILAYYPPATSRYAVVEGEGQVDRTGADDSKVAVSRLHIETEIGLPELVQAGMQYIMDRAQDHEHNAAEHHDWSLASNTGHYSVTSHTGYTSAASNTGHYSVASNTSYTSAAINTGYASAAINTGSASEASNTGYASAASNTEDQSAAINAGYHSAASNTGLRSVASNTGDQSAAINTGDLSVASNTGVRSVASNTGNRSAASAEGQESIAMAVGIDSKAKGVLGCWLVLAEWTDQSDNRHRTDVQCVQVDGDRIKADTWYRLHDGQFVVAD